MSNLASLPMAAIQAPMDGPLSLASAPMPVPGLGQILIKVAGAGVNRPDLLQRRGLYPPPPGAPTVLGLEVSGEIIALGDNTPRWRVGDHVCALISGGGYARYALADAGAALPIPPGVRLEEAAGLPETVFTVWANVFEAGGLRPNETLLVHGGASGIGVMAIQMAKAHGARVLVTAGDARKCAACLALGADRAINYKTKDFAAELAGEGVDVILDMVGAPYAQRNLDLLRTGGRLVYIAFQHGALAELNLMRLMLKRLTITGSTLRARPDAEKARLARAVEAQVWPWIAAGKVKPVIEAKMPLEEADAAHALLEAGGHVGKILLVTGVASTVPDRTT